MMDMMTAQTRISVFGISVRTIDGAPSSFLSMQKMHTYSFKFIVFRRRILMRKGLRFYSFYQVK